MSTELYYNPVKTYDFKSAPIFDDWKYKSEPAKAGLLTFTSPLNMVAGDHLRLMVNNIGLFGGQVAKRIDKKNDFYSYEALDYKHYLLTEVSLNKTNITASSVAKLLSAQTSVLKWNIGTTTHIYSSLVFENKTVLDVLNQLIWLEYEQAHNLILFNVDYNGNLTFKSYPTTAKGYIFTSALDYQSSLDYEDVVTGYQLIDKTTGKIISQGSDKTLQAIWGDINVQEVFDNDGS